MSPDEIHDWIKQKQTQQPRAAPERCPEGVDLNGWKNRHRVSSKLSEANYANLQAYRKRHDINVNVAINTILSYFFEHAHNQRNRQSGS